MLLKLPRRPDGTLDFRGMGSALRSAFAYGRRAEVKPIHLSEPSVPAETFQAAISKVDRGAAQLETVANLGAAPVALGERAGIREALLRIAEDLKR